jgi:peptidoglycan/xylan/chitin deacetylase (PgdA/CDA1 family)
VNAPRAVILMYHRLGAAREPEEGDYAIEEQVFEAQMLHLAARGAAVVDLDTLAAGAYPDRCAALTFDDGCDTDVTVAAPLLRRLGFPASFFVNPARVGSPGRASWPQLRALADQGFRVGSHGLDHTLLDDVPASELERQLVESKRRLEDALGRTVDALSLPGGSGGPRALRTALAAGYRLVLGSRPAPVRGALLARVQPRFPVRAGHGVDGVAAMVEQRPAVVFAMGLRYGITHATRSLLGTRAYGRLRGLWVERAGGRA